VRRLGLQLVAKMPASVDLDDLIQAGMIGLLDAASRYKEDQGAQFETYASQRIRGAMLDELRSNDWLPRSLRRTSREVETAVHKVEQTSRPFGERDRRLPGTSRCRSTSIRRCCRTCMAAS
jgi:RNA polymerase sigma factor for flagellar operon FliA